MTDNQYASTVSETALAAENTSIESAPPAAAQPAWHLDDNTPGQGNRPDWLPAKYNKASDVAKAYTELEKRLGGFTGAPESYDLSAIEVDDSAMIMQEMTAVAKELNMSQEGFNKFIGRLHSAVETESAMTIDSEVKKLGTDGERMLKEYQNWTKNYLKPEEAEVVKEWITNAESLQVFNRMMAHTHMASVPTSSTMGNANHFESVAALRAELTANVKRYDTDKAYQRDFSSRLARAVQREGGG